LRGFSASISDHGKFPKRTGTFVRQLPRQASTPNPASNIF